MVLGLQDAMSKLQKTTENIFIEITQALANMDGKMKKQDEKISKLDEKVNKIIEKIKEIKHKCPENSSGSTSPEK
jgi:septation ring formation regulator EzrA